MFVCAECFENEDGLKKFIDKYAEHTYCDYCGREAEDNISVEFDLVAEHILDSIRTEWNYAVEGLGYAHEMGGYIGDHYDTYDLLDKIELSILGDSLRQDIMDVLGDQIWCRWEFYAPQMSETYIWGWQNFADIIKHKSRYVFLKIKHKLANTEDIQPHEMLNRLGETISSMNLITEWNVGTPIYRARVDKSNTFHTAKELGSPPSKFAKFANRMSPAGISMFYGAFDIDTTMFEIRAETDGIVSVGEFKTLRPLKILDLTNIGEKPSLFGEGNTHFHRETIIFLKKFSEEVCQPIEKDGREHIEYVPTQVFTEYIRYLLRPNNNPIMGIIYPSAVSEGRESCVLFLENEQCSDETSDEAWLQLSNVEHINLNE